MREEIVRAKPCEDEDDDGDTGKHSYRDEPEACTAVMAGLAIGISVRVLISCKFRDNHSHLWIYRRERCRTERLFAVIVLLLGRGHTSAQEGGNLTLCKEQVSRTAAVVAARPKMLDIQKLNLLGHRETLAHCWIELDRTFWGQRSSGTPDH